MLKGEQGYGYSFDPERAIGHLADPEGIESMALGAVGGAVQTFLSEMVSRDKDVSSAKKKASSAQNEVVEKQRAENPQGRSNLDTMNSQVSVMDEYLKARAKSTTPAEAVEAEDRYISESAKNLVMHKDSSLLDARISALKSLIDKGANTSSMEELDALRIANKELEHLSRVKSISEKGDFWKYNNRNEILSAESKLANESERLSKISAEAEMIRRAGVKTKKDEETLDLEAS